MTRRAIFSSCSYFFNRLYNVVVILSGAIHFFIETKFVMAILKMHGLVYVLAVTIVFDNVLVRTISSDNYTWKIGTKCGIKVKTKNSTSTILLSVKRTMAQDQSKRHSGGFDPLARLGEITRYVVSCEVISFLNT